MGHAFRKHNRSTQTKNHNIQRFRDYRSNANFMTAKQLTQSIVSPLKTDPYCCLTRYPNTKTTQTEDEFTINKKFQLKTWYLEEKISPLCAKCLSCKCNYDCSKITSEDISVMFKMLRERKDSFEQFKFLAQHIKLDPYKYKAQFYVRIMRQGSWAIRRICIDTFRHVFRISTLELSELVKRIANYIKENKLMQSTNAEVDTEDSDVEDGDLSDYSQQGYIPTYSTVSELEIRRELLDKWSAPNFQPSPENMSFLESFGLSNCSCDSPRTIRHYLFHCPRFEIARKELLHFSSVEELFKSNKDFVRYVQEFILNATSPQE